MFANFRERKLATLSLKTPETIIPVAVLGRSRGLHVKGQIKSRFYKFLLDTGASRSIVQPNIIEDEQITEVNGYSLKTASSDLMPVLGGVNIKFELGNQSFIHEFLVANITDRCILGLDFMQFSVYI